MVAKILLKYVQKPVVRDLRALYESTKISFAQNRGENVVLNASFLVLRTFNSSGSKASEPRAKRQKSVDDSTEHVAAPLTR